MPPFRSGLLKRKVDASSSRVDSNKELSDEVSSGSEGDEELIKSNINAEGDATDSENEEENSAVSDEEQDEVLYQDETDSTFGDDEEAGGDGDGDESSDLEDSDASDSDAKASDNLGEDEDNHAEDETEDDEVDDSEAESGIGHTTSGSESEKKPESKITKHKNQVKSKEVTRTKQKKQIKSKEESKTSIDRLADSIQNTSVTQPVVHKDEYESGDTSDEEERRNTAGAVPAWWYDEYPHAGYDLDGRKLLKPPQRDHIDEFLKKCEDPEFWRTVRDPATGQDVILSKQDLELLHRIRLGHVPNPDHDEYKPWVEWFTSTVLATPVRAFPEHKRSFLPSRGEQAQVARLVHALRMGWLKTRKQLAEERRRKKEKKFYNLWGSTGSEEEERLRGVHRHIPAPRRALPPHAESYNPPPEYLLDAKEMKEWNKLSETPWKRKYTFLPAQHAALRSVPAYPRFVRERFLRCLDLYLAPRAIKMRLTIDAEALVPRLPAPRSLQPFPTSEALCFRGHAAPVRGAGFDPSGQYVVSASDDATVKVWETSSARCLRTIECTEAATCVAWIPVAGLSLVAVAVGRRLLLLNPGADIGCHRVATATDALLEEPPPKHDVHMDERTAACVTWERVTPQEWARGVRLVISHFKPISHVSWHARGDYLCVTLRDAASRSVLVHQLSRRRSQLPFSRAKGLVQCALFHPTKPILFVATQRAVRMYDLVKQELVRKLLAGAQCISCLAAHPAGDNLLVGTYDRKCVWFDLELSAKPYQTLRLHGGAVRSVAFHRRYPLFASGGDDARVIVSHGCVYNDLLQNPLLVPLKALPGPARREALCALQLAFHPEQPWLLVAGADATLRLYS